MEQLISPAWEGGHPDHDACHLIAHRIQQEREISHITYPTYTGYKSWGPFFRVFSSSPANQRSSQSLWVGPLYWLKLLLITLAYYPSQRRSWFLLSPAILFKTLSQWHWRLYIPDFEAGTVSKPHQGKLLYERHGRYTWKEFELYARKFLFEHA